MLCNQAEETTPHLIQDCVWATEVWMKGEEIFGKMDLNDPNLQDMEEI